MGDGGRASSYGTSAALANPAAMSLSQQFAIEAIYQAGVQSKTHGTGLIVMDSLNSPRIGLGLGYLFLRGTPQAAYDEAPVMDQILPAPTPPRMGQSLGMLHAGHEAFVALSVALIKRWLSVGIKPKFQNATLRYDDANNKRHEAVRRLNNFGLDVSLAAQLGGFVAVSFVAENLVGTSRPPYTEKVPLDLSAVRADPATIDPGYVPRVADYPMRLAHGLAVFPLRNPEFSLNFDGAYDLTSYREGGATKNQNRVRMLMGGSAEFVAGPVPIRAGSYWDSRGIGRSDDRVYVTGGLAYVKPAPLGGVGLDVGVGFSQQVSGPLRETILSLNLALRLHPNL